MRTPIFVFVALACALAGCGLDPKYMAEKQRRDEQQQIEQCRRLGAVTQDQFFQCRMRLEEQRRAANAASGAALQAAGAMLMNPPRRPAPTTTNCHTFMNTITCNTM